VEAKTLLCIACGGGHCDDKVRCHAGSRAEEAESAGSKARLADEDGRGWDCWLVDESSEEGGYDVINVGCDGSIPLFPFGVEVTDR
jgi:hypothetical protein